MKQLLLFVLFCSLIAAASTKLPEDKSFGSALLKQLRRRALLIAAQDGLGATTRDAFLSETAPDGAVQIVEPDRFFVEQFKLKL